MKVWMTVRTFCAVFLVALGVGLMFVRSEDGRLMLGALFVAIGLTFMLRIALVLREGEAATGIEPASYSSLV
jgi:hypothetical protein